MGNTALHAGQVPNGNNVILIVLESVGARDILASDAGLRTIPELQRHGVTFPNMYVPTASSSRSAFAFVTGRFPLFDYRPETDLLRDDPFVTTASRFRQAGYATAFFMGGEFAFANLDAFLVGKGFDHMADMTNIACATHTALANARWRNVDSVSEQCMTDALLGWLGKDRHQPFFAMIWPNDTHFPYFAPQEKAGPKARHAAALREADRQIGRIVAKLAESGELACTSFVIVGDHGEAFFEHGNFSHGSTVYDDEVRVAMVLSPAGDTRGPIDNRIVTLPDVAPTLLGLAGLPGEPRWQGRNLLDSGSRQRVYFFAVLRDYMLGYRERDTKVVLNLSNGSIVKYDLKRDPGERNPIVLGADEARAARRHIAGWVAYQQALYKPNR